MHFQMTGSVFHLNQSEVCPQVNASCKAIEAIESVVVRICISIMTSEESIALHDLTRLHGKRTAKTCPLASPFKLKQLAQTVYLLNVIHRLCSENRCVNQRELFYRSLSDSIAPCFIDQNAMNRALFCLLNSIGCDRHELGIFTTARGLVAACPDTQTLCLDSNSEFIADLSDHPDGMSICENLVGISTLQTSADFILIVEKDTVFQSLLSSENFFQYNACILVTARGYPDNITIRFLKRLQQVLNDKVPFLYLGDLDPHGISIALVYNRALNGAINWIGLHHSDISSLDHQRVLGIKMKPSDMALLNSLIEQPTTPANFRSELAKIESVGMKYEIECLHSVSEQYIATTWLPRKTASVLNFSN